MAAKWKTIGNSAILPIKKSRTEKDLQENTNDSPIPGGSQLVSP
jgi:hypothetical protein